MEEKKTKSRFLIARAFFGFWVGVSDHFRFDVDDYWDVEELQVEFLIFFKWFDDFMIDLHVKSIQFYWKYAAI